MYNVKTDAQYDYYVLYRYLTPYTTDIDQLNIVKPSSRLEVMQRPARVAEVLGESETSGSAVATFHWNIPFISILNGPTQIYPGGFCVYLFLCPSIKDNMTGWKSFGCQIFLRKCWEQYLL